MLFRWRIELAFCLVRRAASNSSVASSRSWSIASSFNKGRKVSFVNPTGTSGVSAVLDVFRAVVAAASSCSAVSTASRKSRP